MHGFGPRGKCHRRGAGPMVQLLRAPLTLNNIIALFITYNVYSDRSALADHTAQKQGMRCFSHRPEALFGALTMFFAISLFHNVLTVGRFHRIRRQVFGEGICAAHKRWRHRAEAGEVGVSEEEREAWRAKFKEVAKKLPSLPIAVADTVLAMHFLGLYILTTLMAKREGKVELGAAYASIGALVAL
jgi:hypothetical protein